MVIIFPGEWLNDALFSTIHFSDKKTKRVCLALQSIQVYQAHVINTFHCNLSFDSVHIFAAQYSKYTCKQNIYTYMYIYI